METHVNYFLLTTDKIPKVCLSYHYSETCFLSYLRWKIPCAEQEIQNVSKLYFKGQLYFTSICVWRVSSKKWYQTNFNGVDGHTNVISTILIFKLICPMIENAVRWKITCLFENEPKLHSAKGANLRFSMRIWIQVIWRKLSFLGGEEGEAILNKRVYQPNYVYSSTTCLLSCKKRHKCYLLSSFLQIAILGKVEFLK